MTDHSARIHKLCYDELKKAAMGQPFGLAVEFTFAPFATPDGIVRAMEPAWFMLVTIKSPLVGEGDIGHGIPVFGVMPADKTFREIAVGLLEQCRQEASQKTAVGLLDKQRQEAMQA